MPQSRSLRPAVVLPALVVALLLVAAAVVPDTIASAVRSVFDAATLSHLLILGAIVAVVSVLVPVPGERHFRWIDAVPWPAAVAVIAAFFGLVWYSLGRATTLPRVFGDELIYTKLAHAFARNGSLATHGYGLTNVVVDGLVYRAAGNGPDGYHAIQVLNPFVMATAAFPAYLLARRALSHRWSLLVAALAVGAPWMDYSALVMTEALFYPVLLWFVVALVRALERPTLARQAVLALALALAFATRTQAVVLGAAVVTAVLVDGWACRSLGSRLRAFLPTLVAYVLVGVALLGARGAGAWHALGAYGALTHGWWHPRGLALWTAANVTSLALGLGVLAALALPLGVAVLLRRDADDGERAIGAAIVSVALWLLLTVVVLSESRFGTGAVHERHLFYVVPLVLIGAFAWLTHGRPRPRLLTAAVITVAVAFAIAMPSGAITSRATDALSFKLWTQLDRASFPSSRQMVLAVAVGAVAIVALRRGWILVLAVALAFVGVAAAADVQTGAPRGIADRYGWIDRSLPAGGRATMLWVGSSSACASRAQEAVYTEFFNVKIDRAGHVGQDNYSRGFASEALVRGPGGVIEAAARPLRPRYVVAPDGLGVAGSRIAGHDLVLWRVEPPLRVTGEPGACEGRR